ncbi:MAG: hypothetical protein ABIO29_01370 [Sphingomicrobium sp.]
MRWLSALFIGAIVGFVAPMMGGGRDGIWMHSWVKTGTIRPFENSPGLLFSIPVALGMAFILRMALSWHRD